MGRIETTEEERAVTPAKGRHPRGFLASKSEVIVSLIAISVEMKLARKTPVGTELGFYSPLSILKLDKLT